MPFLGVYDNVRYSPYCTPTYQHWGWGCSFCTFAPKVLFPDYLERGMADTKLHPLSCIYTINRHEFVELYWQKNVADEVLKNCK